MWHLISEKVKKISASWGGNWLLINTVYILPTESVNSQTNLKKNHSFQYTTWQEINTESELLTPMLRAPSGGFTRFSRSALQFMVLKNRWSLMALVSPNAPSRLCGFFGRNWEKQKIINQLIFTSLTHIMCPTWVLQVCKHNWYRSCTCTGQARDFHHSINFTSAGTQHCSAWLL